MGIIEKAVDWAIRTANDNSHGYSQADRWGPDYDCSSFVIQAYEQAGLSLREAGASYTGNMRGAFIACGFVDVTTLVGLSSGYGLQPGDVLLNYAAHTCMFIGGGNVANARTNEGNWQTGDQSGNEIRIQTYWNFPWNCVLRYKEPIKPGSSAQAGSGQGADAPKPVSGADTVPEVDHSLKLPMLRMGSRGDAVKVAQALLALRKFKNVGNIDGDFGPRTQAMVNAFQDWAGIEIDGIIGPETWEKLMDEEVTK